MKKLIMHTLLKKYLFCYDVMKNEIHWEKGN